MSRFADRGVAWVIAAPIMALLMTIPLGGISHGAGKVPDTSVTNYAECLSACEKAKWHKSSQQVEDRDCPTECAHLADISRGSASQAKCMAKCATPFAQCVEACKMNPACVKVCDTQVMKCLKACQRP